MKCAICILFVISSLGASAQFVSGQSVEYAYDAAGNRVLRQVWTSSSGGGSGGGGSSNKTDFTDRGDTTSENALQETTSPAIYLYPNPTTSMLLITLDHVPDEQKNTIEIFSSQGKSMLKEVTTAKEHHFDLSGFAPGIYLVHIRNSKMSHRKMVVKQ